jgi:hypothetical protein
VESKPTNGAAWLHQWFMPAVIMAVASTILYLGIYIGRQEAIVELTALKAEIQQHHNLPHHSGGVSSELLAIQLARIEQRISDLRERIDELYRRQERLGASR